MSKKVFLVFIFLLFLDSCYAATIHGSIYDQSFDEMEDVIIEVNSSPKQNYISKDATYSFELPVGDYRFIAAYYESDILTASSTEEISINDEGDYVLDIIMYPSFEQEDSLLEDIEKFATVDNIVKNSKKQYLWIIFGGMLFFIGLLIYGFSKKNVKKTRDVLKARKERKIRIKEEEQNVKIKDDVKAELKHESENVKTEIPKEEPNVEVKHEQNHGIKEEVKEEQKAEVKEETKTEEIKTETPSEEQKEQVKEKPKFEQYIPNVLDGELDKIIKFIRENDGRTTQKDIRKAFPSSEAKISLMLTELEHKGLIKRIKKGRGNIIIGNR